MLRDGTMIKKAIIFVVVTIALIWASIEVVRISRQTEQGFANAVRVMRGEDQ